MRALPSRIPEIVVIVAVCAWAYLAATARASTQAYAIDEFTYAHAAWMIDRGMEPYRDFFFHHFPFALELWAARIVPKMASFEVLSALRSTMVATFVMCLFCQSYLLRSFGIFAQVSVIVIGVACVPFRGPALEIRPDALGFALFVFSATLLSCALEHVRAQSRSWWKRFVLSICAGIIVSLAVWCSEKVLFYGVPLFVVVLAHSPIHRARGMPLGTFLGVMIGIGGIVASLVTRGLLAQWYEWGVLWQILHEKYYPLRETSSEMLILFHQWWWLVLLALLPYAIYAKLDREHQDRLRVLALGVVLAGISYLIQRGPYYYSLLPLFGFLSMLGAIGGAVLLRRVSLTFTRSHPDRREQIEQLVSVVTVALVFFVPRNYQDHTVSQREFLTALEEQVKEEQCVYDNTGIAVARPSAHYFYYTDKLARLLLQKKLEEEIPRALDDRRCPAMIVDRRFAELSPALQRSLRERYREVTPRLWVWRENRKRRE